MVRLLSFLLLLALASNASAEGPLLDVDSQLVLKVPPLSDGEPGAGKRVIVRTSQYADTDVFHTLYLPPNWRPDSQPLPVIFEYTGNLFPASGSSGEPEDAGLGYGLSAGKFIWVSLPYISNDGKDNQRTWWGDVGATIAYAKRNVPSILKSYNGDPNAVFLCGFSRGAIGVNFLGLHDDEVSKLWTAFVTHDHFDGVREWRGTDWGSPLATYQQDAAVRLKQVRDRPYLVSQNGTSAASEAFVRSVLGPTSNFTFSDVKTAEALGPFPNAFAKAAHNDTWLLKPSRYRTKTWQWMNQVLAAARK